MKKVNISIFIALLLVTFLLFGVNSVLAATQGGDDGFHSDAVKGGEEGFHPG